MNNPITAAVNPLANVYFDGKCRVRLPGSDALAPYGAGQSISVPGATAFDIEVTQTLHYVCHFG